MWSIFASLMVVLSVVTDAMMTLPMFQTSFEGKEADVVNRMANMVGLSNATASSEALMKPLSALIYTNAVSLVFLTIEFIVLILACPRKREFICTFNPIALCIGYASYWTCFVLYLQLANINSRFIMMVYVILQYCSVLKILRLFFITRHVPSMKVIGLTFSSSKKELAIFVFVLTILVCMFGVSMYVAELTYNNKITNIPNAMYWALITLTTVGYGDYTPVTTAGHLIASVCAACGVLVLTMPIGVIASTFYSFYNCNKYATMYTSRYQATQISSDLKTIETVQKRELVSS